MPDTLTDLHDTRQDKGRQRQPTFDAELKDLQAFLSKNGATHPYQLDKRRIRKLMRVPHFCNGLAGRDVPAPDQKYIYRVCAVGKVADYTTGWTSTRPRKSDQPALIFRLWERELTHPDHWLALDDYAQGQLVGPRGFTFWTSHELQTHDPRALIRDAHRLGLPNNWLDEFSVILRCRVSYLKTTRLTHVPSVLDGFDSEIFHPTREARQPNSGVTIELATSAPLGRGCDEFVVGPIATHAIELRPVMIPVNTSPHIASDDTQLLSLLQIYYNNL